LTEVYLLLGSNLNEPALQLAIARKLITKQVGLIVSESHEYRSAPWGVIDQPDFLNQVLCVQTSFSALELLACLQQIELKMGRERIVKWGSRIIDIDILYFGNDIITNSHLKIPHPELQNRRFTLIPLCDLAPEFIHPVFNISNKTLLNRCTDNGEVHQL
jgi:2-amino-4-hydroxy-6-hydroxymethyldihydropteridine diphosphokinase